MGLFFLLALLVLLLLRLVEAGFALPLWRGGIFFLLSWIFGLSLYWCWSVSVAPVRGGIVVLAFWPFLEFMSVY